MGDAPPPAPAPPPPAPTERPTGVTILAVLYFIQGIIMMVTGYLIDSFFGSLFDLAGDLGGADTSGVSLMCLLPFIILGIFYFLIGFGLLKLKSWARTIAIIFAIIGLLGIPIGTIISIIILIYLFKPEVKAAFGK